MATRMPRVSNNWRVLSVFREIDAQWVAEVRVSFVRKDFDSNLGAACRTHPSLPFVAARRRAGLPARGGAFTENRTSLGNAEQKQSGQRTIDRLQSRELGVFEACVLSDCRAGFLGAGAANNPHSFSASTFAHDLVARTLTDARPRVRSCLWLSGFDTPHLHFFSTGMVRK